MTIKDRIRRTKLFRSNKTQAVRIPVSMEFQSEYVIIRREGNKLIIEPAPTNGLLEILDHLEPLTSDDRLPDLKSENLPLREIDL